MAVRRSLSCGLALLTMTTAGCGLADRFAMIRQLQTPPALSQLSGGVQSFAQVDAGIDALGRRAVQDALFAAQAGNRDRTLLALQSARAVLDHATSPADGPLTASRVGQLIDGLQASTISAQSVADTLQSGLTAWGPAPAGTTDLGQPPGTVCCWHEAPPSSATP